MFCKYCGRQIADGSLFCPGCGNRLDSAQEQTPPAQQTPPSQPGSYPNYTPTTPPPAGGYRPNGGYQSPNNAANFSGYPMGWYKFLIYFALFASCVLNALSAIGMFSGMIYGDASGLVYAIFGGLRIVDILYGLVMAAMAVLAILTRQKLAQFRKDGPTYLLMLYVINMAVSVIYLILVTIIVGDMVLTGEVMGQYLLIIVVSIVMIVVNNIYFKKRASLFVN